MADTTGKDDKSSGPLFFWREFEEPWGFMSQWYDSPFEVDGVMYASTEMWMMIQKAKLFGDEVQPCSTTTSHRNVVSLTVLAGNRGENDADDGTIGTSSTWTKSEGLLETKVGRA